MTRLAFGVCGAALLLLAIPVFAQDASETDTKACQTKGLTQDSDAFKDCLKDQASTRALDARRRAALAAPRCSAGNNACRTQFDPSGAGDRPDQPVHATP